MIKYKITDTTQIKFPKIGSYLLKNGILNVITRKKIQNLEIL